MKIVAINHTDNKFVSGDTRGEIVSQLFDWNVNNRVLTAKMRGYKQVTYHSYSEDYTIEEMRIDANKFLFGKLSDFGYQIYKPA